LQDEKGVLIGAHILLESASFAEKTFPAFLKTLFIIFI